MDRIATYYFNLPIMLGAFPDVLKGFWMTILVSLVVIAGGIAVGLALAIVSCLKLRAVNALIVVYVDIFRTLPQLVVIIFIYFGLPYLGVTLSPFATTVAALGMVLSAFACEIFRSAIQALPKGQWDAANALGLRYLPILFLVMLPQALRLSVPLLTNRALAIAKGAALGTAVSLPETLGQAQSVMALVANPSPLTLAAAFYLLFFLPLVVASRWLEHSSARHTVGAR